MLKLAIRAKASDLHLSVNHRSDGFTEFLLRLRISGILIPVETAFLQEHYTQVVARIKLMAKIDTIDVFAPQDGEYAVSTRQGKVVLRVATLPSWGYEEIVIRFQQKHDNLFKLDQLELDPQTLKMTKRTLSQKSGLIILNGPAGSGKTTTIYAMLRELISPSTKIITAEDPVERRLPFVCHTQVSPKVSMAGLAKSIMRQDANVIFVGEVRDPESAEITMQLAQTGHLVLTTLHTRDSIGAITRLSSFGVLPELIASSLVGSLAQRLVKTLCEHCRVSDPRSGSIQKLVQKVGFKEAPDHYYKKGKGCEHCLKGYKGRKAIFELFCPPRRFVT